MKDILLDKPGKKIILLGNEAIVRGALELGVEFVSTYPGTPASEIGNTFFKLSQDKEYKEYFEFSVNEKTALEAAIGASFSGLKTLVAMKNFGVNVCLDALMPFVYTGTKGPTVIVVADDPSCHSSAQSEENSRGFANLAHIPILEPADPQECKDFLKLAFQISEKFKIPIILRTTTRVNHQRMPVQLGKIAQLNLVAGEFIKNPQQFVTLPPRVLEMKKELLEKIEKIRAFAENSSVNLIDGGRTSINKKAGIITSGVSYLNVKEALKELDLDLPILKLGFFYPLPEQKIKTFLRGLKKVLIVEELEPYLENEVARLAKEANCKLEVVGKKLLPEIGELKPEIIISAIAKFTNYKLKSMNFRSSPRFATACVIGNWKSKIPQRSPQFCPGCSYWSVVSAIKKSVDPAKVIFGGDIGCYMLFGTPAIGMQDYLSCMGSSIGIAHGIKKALRLGSGQADSQKLITFIGDSTFLHAGIPALINTIFNKSNPLIIILDNQTTAMTGHQPNPAMATKINSEYKFGFTDPDFSAKGDGCQPAIIIEDIVRACGVKNLKVIDPIKQEEFVSAIKEFLEKEEVSVIIARRMCVLFAKSLK
ncbi:MAG: thiamine pyrophosphate-dependent enzyme [bacterium]|nr:thiamine pyrophosphate-dependent enzyme [bacterium]